MGPIGCPATSVRIYHGLLRNSPGQHGSHLLRGGSPKSRTGHPSGLLHSNFLTKTLYTFLHHACHMPRPFHFPWLFTILTRPAWWSSSQSFFWLLIMRSRVQSLVLPRGLFLEGENSHGDYGLGSSVELRLKTSPGTSYITTHLIRTT
jgi:hypothetical protein